MSTTIDIDFEQLQVYINELKKLEISMDEPSYKKVEFWTGGTSGSGFLLDSLCGFCEDTIEYYKVIHLLIKYSISYLEKIGGVKVVDSEIAKKYTSDAFQNPLLKNKGEMEVFRKNMNN